VNTGRFVGSRSRTSGARLEDTITKNNLEAVKEVVRQLRLRDIGGIIVIDFIDMANPKNRATVEGALRTELERDRTKTYVVEISPLGLVEMTRQNVTDGPREIMTKKCPTCGGDGIILSETSAAVEIERRLRALAGASRHQAYRVEVAAKVASILIGPGAERLIELEKQTRRRFYLQAKDDTHLDHFLVLAEGKREELAAAAPVEEGATIELQLVEVGLHDPHAGVGKLDGIDVCVADAAKLVGKKVKVEVERVLDGTAYATVVGRAAEADTPITAESEAEKPTRRAPAAAAKTDAGETAAAADELEDEEEPDLDEEQDTEEEGEPDTTGAEATGEAGAPPKKKTRRGSRGGRGRKKKTATAPAAAAGNGVGEPEAVAPPVATARIHVPAPDLGEPDEPAPSSDGGTAADSQDGEGQQLKPKKKTRRGTRGGRGRKKKTAAAVPAGEGGDTPEAAPEPEAAPSQEADSDWDYVPMSQWDDADL
jgi:ribonuclease G